MDKLPRVPSKREAHAKVRCKGEENRLSSVKDELDKVWQAESRFLGSSRNRFILDRRRSLGNVYNSQIEGIQPHRRIRRRRLDSAPEVIEIFRRQEDRRQSVKVIEKAVTQDVMRRLERKYQEALARDGSDVDDDDSGSDAEIILVSSLDIQGPDFEQVEKDHRKREASERGKAEPSDSFHKKLGVSQASGKTTATKQLTSKKALDQKQMSRFENRNDLDEEASRNTRTVPRDAPLRHSDVIKPEPKSTAPNKEVRQRKRSHSDGNIVMNILELQKAGAYPFVLAQPAPAAGRGRSDENDSEDELRMPFRQGTYVKYRAEEFSGSRSSSETPEDELSDSDTDVSDPSPLTKRHVRGVYFDEPPRDVTTRTRRHGDVRFQPIQHDIMRSPKLHHRRGGSSPHNEEIQLSPSLKRRLASIDLLTPRKEPASQLSDVTHSPSMTRRRADVSFDSPQIKHRVAAADAAPDSPSLPLRKKDCKPKPIFQKAETEKSVFKRRPLRRSRSEAVDISTLVTFREKGVVEVARRGSDSFQGVSREELDRKPPRVWNSLLFGLALTQEEKEEIARHKRKELVASLRKRQEEVDGDVSRRIQTFLQRYDDV